MPGWLHDAFTAREPFALGEVDVRFEGSAAVVAPPGRGPEIDPSRLRAAIRTGAEGRYPNWDDERQVRRVAFLGSDAKKQLFGTRPALGETLRVGDFPYTVVGVMRHKGQDSSYDGRDNGKGFLPLSLIHISEPPRPY